MLLSYVLLSLTLLRSGGGGGPSDFRWCYTSLSLASELWSMTDAEFALQSPLSPSKSDTTMTTRFCLLPLSLFSSEWFFAKELLSSELSRPSLRSFFLRRRKVRISSTMSVSWARWALAFARARRSLEPLLLQKERHLRPWRPICLKKRGLSEPSV